MHAHEEVDAEGPAESGSDVDEELEEDLVDDAIFCLDAHSGNWQASWQ